jgi:hypothetical protein
VKVWRSNADPYSVFASEVHGLPAYQTSGLVLYTKVTLWSSKSEHGTLTGRVLVYVPNIGHLLSGFVSLIRVCHIIIRSSRANCVRRGGMSALAQKRTWSSFIQSPHRLGRARAEAFPFPQCRGTKTSWATACRKVVASFFLSLTSISSQFARHPHEFGHVFHPQFFHSSRSIHFNSFFCNPQLGGDVPVQHAANNQS